MDWWPFCRSCFRNKPPCPYVQAPQFRERTSGVHRDVMYSFKKPTSRTKLLETARLCQDVVDAAQDRQGLMRFPVRGSHDCTMPCGGARMLLVDYPSSCAHMHNRLQNTWEHYSHVYTSELLHISSYNNIVHYTRKPSPSQDCQEFRASRGWQTQTFKCWPA